MKKILSILILFLYSCSNAFALSELYYLKNINVTEMMPKVENAYSAKNYTLIKKNPYYGTNNKTAGEYAIVITQQSGDNMFYYYQSNDDNSINKQILKQLKSSKIEYEKSENSHIISIYEKLASQIIDPNKKPVYNFEDQETIAENKTKTSKKSDSLKGYVAQIEKGTKFGAYLQNPINTSTASVGDEIIAVLTDNWTYQGYTIAPQGSVVYGTLTLARHAQYGSRNGRVVIDFNKVVTPNGRILNISTEKIDFTVENNGKVSSTVRNVAAGAVVGALSGLILSALTGSENVGRAVAIGAGIGAGGSLATSTIQRGVDAEIPSYTELEIELSKMLRITLSEWENYNE